MSPAEHLTIYVFVLKVHLSQLPNLIPALGSILIGNVLKLAAMKAGGPCATLELKSFAHWAKGIEVWCGIDRLKHPILAQRHIGPASCIWR